MTVRELGALLRRGRASSVELVQDALRQIKEKDRFHTFITLTPERAFEAAIDADKERAAGIDRGPFHGVPVAYKDIIYTRGVKTTAGSLLFQDFVPDYDAAVVEKLNAGGAVSLGKLNLHELAYGATSKNPHYGFVLNPHNPEHVAGGSSGGSAVAVSLGYVPVALGSDTGGSIRIPASYCGVAGLKPTFGRVSRYGVMALAFSLDTVGPLGATVEDCALAMAEIAGYDRRDASCAEVPVPDFYEQPSHRLNGVRVGIPENFYFDDVAPDVAAKVMDLSRECERLGATLSRPRLPDIEAVNATARMIQWGETTALYGNAADPSLIGPDVWGLIQQGWQVSAPEYVNAQRMRRVFREQFDALWQDVDVLLAPSTPVTAPRVDSDEVEVGGRREDARLASTRLVRAINLLGEPALSLPCGSSVNGLPIGAQLIAPPFTDAWLLRLGQTLERAIR
jgi:aspartyl-tRNA(Asn)/glutamyl-tRNA(Gln) amidotransferase subunit A